MIDGMMDFGDQEQGARIDRESRQGQILKHVRQRQGVRVRELCRMFAASEATIRRDLDDLQEAGLIRRTHGGALPVIAEQEQREVLKRADFQASEKRAIARMAASMVNDGETVFIGSGSTTIHMPEWLRDRKEITVITNSLPIINKLVDFPSCKTVILGGVLRNSELSIIGHIAAKTLDDLRAHKVFMGAEAIHLHHGLTNSYLEETMTDRAIINISKDIILLADHTKFGGIHASFWAPLETVSCLITDSETDVNVVEAIREKGVKVIVVPGDSESPEST